MHLDHGQAGKDSTGLVINGQEKGAEPITLGEHGRPGRMVERKSGTMGSDKSRPARIVERT
jgi:hypothetical protein